jgi:hypothetical protein
MHAIERPRLPRVGVVALGALALAIVVLLLAASRLGDIGLSSHSASTDAATGASAQNRSAPPVASSWLWSNPFKAPFRVVLPWNTPARR